MASDVAALCLVAPTRPAVHLDACDSACKEGRCSTSCYSVDYDRRGASQMKACRSRCMDCLSVLGTALLLVLDPHHPKHYRPSTSSYDYQGHCTNDRTSLAFLSASHSLGKVLCDAQPVAPCCAAYTKQGIRAAYLRLIDRRADGRNAQGSAGDSLSGSGGSIFGRGQMYSGVLAGARSRCTEMTLS